MYIGGTDWACYIERIFKVLRLKEKWTLFPDSIIIKYVA